MRKKTKNIDKKGGAVSILGTGVNPPAIFGDTNSDINVKFDSNAALALIKECGFQKESKDKDKIITCEFPIKKEISDKKVSDKKVSKVTEDAGIAKMSCDVELLSRTSSCVEYLLDSVIDKYGCLYVPNPNYQYYQKREFPDIPIVKDNVEVKCNDLSDNNRSDLAGKGVEYEVSCLFRCYDNFGDKPVRNFVADSFLIRFNSQGTISYSYASISHKEVDGSENISIDIDEQEEWKRNVDGLQKLLGGDKEKAEKLHDIIEMLSNNQNSKLHDYIQKRAEDIYRDYSEDDARLRLNRGIQIAVFTNNIYLNKATKETFTYTLISKDDQHSKEIKVTNDFLKNEEPAWAYVRIEPNKNGKGIEVVEEYAGENSNLQNSEMFLGEAKFCFAHVNDQATPVLSIYAEKNESEFNGYDAIKIKYKKDENITDDYGVRRHTKEVVYYSSDSNAKEFKIEQVFALTSQCTKDPIVYLDAKGNIKEEDYGLSAQVEGIVYEKSGNFIMREGFAKQTVSVWYDRETVKGFPCQTKENVWCVVNGELKSRRCFCSKTANIIYKYCDGVYNESAYGYKDDTVKIMFEKNGELKSAIGLDKQTCKIVYKEYSGAFSKIYSGFPEQTEEILFYENEKVSKKRALKSQIQDNILYVADSGDVVESSGFISQAVNVKFVDRGSGSIEDRQAFKDVSLTANFIENGNKEQAKFLTSQVVQVPFTNDLWCVANIINAEIVTVGSDGKFMASNCYVPNYEEYKQYSHNCAFCGKEIYADKNDKRVAKLFNRSGQFICPACYNSVSDCGATTYSGDKAMINDDGMVYIEEDRHSPQHTVFCNHSDCCEAKYEHNSKGFVKCPNCKTAFCDKHIADLHIFQSKNGKEYCQNCAEEGKVVRESKLYHKIKHNIDFGERRSDNINYLWDKTTNKLSVDCEKHCYSFQVSGGKPELEDNEIAFETSRRR